MGKFQAFRLVDSQHINGIDAVRNRDGEPVAIFVPPIQETGEFRSVIAFEYRYLIDKSL